MGKRKGGKSHARDKKSRTNTWQQDAAGAPKPPPKQYKELVLESEKFTAYYKEQLLVPDNEWDEFIAVLKTPLPVTFRITGTMFSEEIRRKLSTEFKLEEVTLDDGTKVEPPQPIPWYPEGKAWEMNISKKNLKKVPALEKLHKFLMFQSDEGNATRQEAVSMLPPLLAAIEPHHAVLDMCAAPGSKTSQIIEYLHANDTDMKKPPTGFVVANDLDLNRCYLLTHQIKRLDSPCVLVTNHEAQNFPFIKVPPQLVADGGLEGVARDGRLLFVFDRIICDVPCSGDGTLRKAPDLWQRWSPGLGLGLHRLQCKIAIRGANLLKVGGRMVYSTCSMNPVENEAVVAELLRYCKGALRLVDMSSALPALKRRPGLSTWRVQDHKGTWYNAFSDITTYTMRQKVAATAFPPTAAEAADMHLDRCLRMLPHDQNTGAFFVAVLEKVAPITSSGGPAVSAGPAVPQQQATDAAAAAAVETPADGKTAAAAESTTEEPVLDQETAAAISQLPPDVAGKPTASAGGGPRRRKEEPFLPIPPDMQPVVDQIRKYYGLTDDFPAGRWMIRSEHKDKLSVKTYYVGDTLRQYAMSDDRSVLRPVAMGVKMLNRHDAKNSDCDYRLGQEGIRWLLPFMRKRVITVADADVTTLLTTHDPLVSQFSELARKQLMPLDIDQGCVVFVLDQSAKQFAGLALVGWRGKQSCHLLVAKKEQISLRDLLGIPQPDLPPKGAAVAKPPAAAPAAVVAPAAAVAPTPADATTAASAAAATATDAAAISTQDASSS